MTYKEIFIKAVAQATGKAEEEVTDIFRQFQEHNPGGQWDKTMSDQEAEALLVTFKAEAPGILASLERGRRTVESLNTGAVN